jgi:hypothetical protein
VDLPAASRDAVGNNVIRATVGEGAVGQRRDQLRAADVDRAFVADLLKKAVDEGRLSLSEYDERLQRTYEARTYGELDQVIGDLPRPSRRTALTPSTPPVPSPATPGWSPKPEKRDPNWLVHVWGAWALAVAVNTVIWLIVCVTTGDLIYPWPLWVAGPWGAVLLVTTVFGRGRGGGRS